MSRIKKIYKRCSTSYVNREKQIKTKRYHYTPIRMAKIQKTNNTKCQQGCGATGTLIHCWQACKMVYPLWKTVWRFLKKLNILSPYDPTTALFGIYPKELKTCPHKHLHLNVYSSFIHNCQNWNQPTCPLVDGWINKRWYILLFSTKRKLAVKPRKKQV